MNFPVAILAGGLATRLHPITLVAPKSLLPINNKPFIQLQLELLANQGIKSVVLCLGHKASEIVQFVRDGRQFGLKVEYSIEEATLGTGGAIRNAEKYLGEIFGVLYGDSYLPINYLEVFKKFRESKKMALMTVYENNDKFDASNALFRTDGNLYYSKSKKLQEMRYIDYGFSVLSLEALRAIPDEVPSDLSDMFEKLSEKGEIVGFEVRQRFYEIGSFEGIVELEKYLRRKTK